MVHLRTTLTALVMGTFCSTLPAVADDTIDGLVIELNATSPNEAGCVLSFFVTNGVGADIDALVLETVLMDASGRVDRLTLFDFADLPAGRPRVRQFAVAGQVCEGIGAVLINGAQTCTSRGAPMPDCEARFDLRSRTDIDLIG